MAVASGLLVGIVLGAGLVDARVASKHLCEPAIGPGIQKYRRLKLIYHDSDMVNKLYNLRCLD